MRGALQKTAIILLAFLFSACTGGLGGNPASPLGGGFGSAGSLSPADGSGKGGPGSGNTDGTPDGSDGGSGGGGSPNGAPPAAASVANGTGSSGGDSSFNVAQNFAPGGTVGSQSDTPDINTDDPCYKNPYKVSFSDSHVGGGVDILVGNKVGSPFVRPSNSPGGDEFAGGALRMCDLGALGGDPLQGPGSNSFNCRDFTVGAGGLVTNVNVDQNKNYLFVFLPPGTSSGGANVITRDQLGALIQCKTQGTQGLSAYTLGSYQFNSF